LRSTICGKRTAVLSSQGFEESIHLAFEILEAVVIGRSILCDDAGAGRDEHDSDQAEEGELQLGKQHGFENSFGQGDDRGRRDSGQGSTGPDERRDADCGID
jgi:hypothetical protein